MQDLHEELRQRAREGTAAAASARDALQASRECQVTAAQRLALEAERVHTLELMRLNGVSWQYACQSSHILCTMNNILMVCTQLCDVLQHCFPADCMLVCDAPERQVLSSCELLILAFGRVMMAGLDGVLAV